MSWHFSQALEAEYLEASCLDGEPLPLWSSMPFAPDDSCSDKMKATCHRSPFGMMYVPLMDGHGKALLTWYREGFHVKDIPPQLREKTMQMISGRKCGGSWQMSLPGTYQPKTSAERQLSKRQKTSLKWVTPSTASSYPRRTWVLTTFGNDTGFVHTPTCTANYAAKSMQKWACAREFTRVFGRPTPTNHEWLMGWPIGWSGCEPLETDRFQSWQQQHGDF